MLRLFLRLLHGCFYACEIYKIPDRSTCDTIRPARMACMKPRHTDTVPPKLELGAPVEPTLVSLRPFSIEMAPLPYRDRKQQTFGAGGR